MTKIKAGSGDLRTLANGLFPVGGPEASNLPPEGRDEVRAAMEVILKMHDYQSTKLSLALEQLDKAVDEIEQLRGVRELLVKALMKSTGAEETAIREAPMAEAVKAAAEIEQLRADMTEIRKVLAHVAGDIRAVFHERPDLYKAIIRVDTIALDPK